MKLLTSNWTVHTDGMFVITPKTLQEFGEDFSTSDRNWRWLTLNHKELRGNDYDTKQIVVERKQIEIGYESNYKKLSTVKIDEL